DHPGDDARAFATGAARGFASGAFARPFRVFVDDRRGRRLQFGLAMDADKRPGFRADHAVDVEPVTGLEAAYRGLGRRTDYAVGREPVARLQAAHSGLCFGAELTVGG